TIMLIGIINSFCSDPKPIINYLKKEYKFKDGRKEYDKWIEDHKNKEIIEFLNMAKTYKVEIKDTELLNKKKPYKSENETTDFLKMVKNKYDENYVIIIKRNAADLKTDDDVIEIKTNYTENYELTEELKEYRKSSLFLLLAVDNKLKDKYEYWKKNKKSKDSGNSQIFEFMEESDKWWDNDKNHEILSIADHTVKSDLTVNADLTELTDKSKKELRNIMSKYTTCDGKEIKVLLPKRPTKNAYFMYLAELTASRTNCMSRKVGCVLVKNGYRVIATGYNGTPTNIKHCIEGNCKSCSGKDKNLCKCIHAEENAPYKDLEDVEGLFKEADEAKKEAKRKAEVIKVEDNTLERLEKDSLPPKNF
ncbi:34765_t:CDS:2, partial [Racocetra persica]